MGETRQTPQFGKKLRQLREAIGKHASYEALAGWLMPYLGGHRPSNATLFRYEEGRLPSPPLLWALAKFHGLDPGGFLEECVAEWCGAPLEEQDRAATGRFDGTEDERLALVRLRRLDPVGREVVLALVESWSDLSMRDREFIAATLSHVGVRPRGEFRKAWDGNERRTGNDRRTR